MKENDLDKEEAIHSLVYGIQCNYLEFSGRLNRSFVTLAEYDLHELKIINLSKGTSISIQINKLQNLYIFEDKLTIKFILSNSAVEFHFIELNDFKMFVAALFGIYESLQKNNSNV